MDGCGEIDWKTTMNKKTTMNNFKICKDLKNEYYLVLSSNIWYNNPNKFVRMFNLISLVDGTNRYIIESKLNFDEEFAIKEINSLDYDLLTTKQISKYDLIVQSDDDINYKIIKNRYGNNIKFKKT